MGAMPFDVFTIAAIRDELEGTVVGSRVDKVIQPSHLSVALKLYGRGQNNWLLASASAVSARVYLTQSKLAKGFETPSPFIMLLRKYVLGARLETVHQVHLERVLMLEFSTADRPPVTLVVEIMGNRSNVILKAEDGVILGALKLIGPHQSRIRRIVPHAPYELPPAQSRAAVFGADMTKIDPLAGDSALSEVKTLLASADTGTKIKDALVGLLVGCSPAIAGDIALRAGAAPTDSLAAISPDGLVRAVSQQYGLIPTRQWNPITITRDERGVDFRAYDEPSLANAVPASSMSAAIDQVSEGRESTDALTSVRDRVRAGMARRKSEIGGRIASLTDGLAASAGAPELREAGDMILGYQYNLQPGATELNIPELDFTVRLDPTQTPVENAERYFKRYRKAREAGKKIPDLLASAKLDLAFIEELEMYVDLAQSTADLARVEAEFAARFGGRKSQKKRQAGTGKPLTVTLQSGEVVMVGRSARQNEEVTFKLAGRSDLWLHVRGMPGSHVILRGASSQANQAESQAVEAAASLAAHFSKARTDNQADVDVTRVRDVHRRPGGAPGQVTYRNERTLRVKPLPPEALRQDAHPTHAPTPT
jgi:predicted ribosome quality control (RQC) complex YloA/Tae2 family protein